MYSRSYFTLGRIPNGRLVGPELEPRARVLASLDHPNIAAIYGLEESNCVRALVLALVDGPTLADRIASGAIPLVANDVFSSMWC
jgi:hypothetical protein